MLLAQPVRTQRADRDRVLAACAPSRWRAGALPPRPLPGGTRAPLYFAFHAAEMEARARASTPYTFQGKVDGWEDLGEIPESGGLHKVRVSFSELR
jgi:hypothetical protein